MSFYGNITNTTKTGFSFDRIYPNRTEMEANMKTDGVYIGRFVLVDYDQDSENVGKAYFDLDLLEKIDNETIIYLFADSELTHKIQFNSEGIVVENDITTGEEIVTGVNKNDILYVRLNDSTKDFFVCTGEYIKYAEDGINILERYAEFKRFTQGPDYEGIYRWNYAINYNTDQSNFGDKYSTSIGRGWDSTVWQKVFENGVEKYVMTAELNSVVPTFAISADAPSLMPVPPHFDEVSNNTYYELHAQPQWGVRIKHAYGHLSADPQVVGVPGVDYIHYEPYSDIDGYWIQPVENKELGITQYYYYSSLSGGTIEGSWELVDIDYPLDGSPVSFSDVLDYVSRDIMSRQRLGIYLNTKGFKSQSHSHSTNSDAINLYPTGYSQTPVFKKNEKTGKTEVEWVDTEYNDHTRGTTTKKPDTLELEVYLPSIGNALNSMWNIIYGVGINGEGKQVFKIGKDGQYVYENGRPLGLNGYHRTRFIDWIDGEETSNEKRMRLVKEKEKGDGFDYDVEDIETIAGCINSVHDLMGMIISDKTEIDLTDENAVKNFVKTTDADKIYYLSDGGYYRRGIGYNYTPLDYKYEEIKVSEDEYQENFYYYVIKDSDEHKKIISLEEQFEVKYEEFLLQVEEIDNEYEHKEKDQEYLRKISQARKEYKEKIQALYDSIRENLFEDLNNIFDISKVYYVKKINNPEAEYKTIKLDQYEQYKYYYLSGDNYMNEKNNTARNVQYYLYSGKIKEEKAISMDFIENRYWELLDNGNYQPTSDTYPRQEKYYVIGNDKTLETHVLEMPSYYDKVNETYQGKILSYFWSPGAFAIKNADGSYDLTDMESDYDPTAQYYMLDFEKETIYDADGGVYYIPRVKNAYKVNLINIGENKYYRQVYSSLTGKYTYFLATQDIINEEYKDLGRARLIPENGYPDNYVPNFGKNNYYTLNDINGSFTRNKFYVPNQYYYNDANEDQIGHNEDKGNYIKDKELKYTEGRIYYSLLSDTFIPVKNPFYIPNKYYQQYIDEVTKQIYYILDKSFKKDETATYYDRKYFYVQHDKEGLYSVGSQWNRGVEQIPCTIDLSSIEEVYELKLLNGFARTFNTIHGLIIEINKILLSGDYNTRDRNTVQGCINLMNDIINRFDEFSPTKFLISDNYGRVASANEDSNDWIDIDIIGNPGKPMVRIEHTYPFEKPDTTSESNMNTLPDDFIELETVVLDEMGHVTNVNKETRTLPYNFKYITVMSPQDREAELRYASNSVIAENTKDSLYLSQGNKWIKMNANPTNHHINIGHEVHEITKEPIVEVNPNEDELITFTTVLPRGRMYGDIQYDGVLDTNDMLYLEGYIANWEGYQNPDNETLIAMDITDNGNPDMMDAAYLKYYLQEESGYKDLLVSRGDILNNWVVNPNHTLEKSKFYKDIENLDISAKDTLVILGYKNITKFNIDEENNKLRIYVSLLPKEDTEITIIKLSSHSVLDTCTEQDIAGHITKQTATNYQNINDYGIFSDGENYTIAENEKDVFTFKGDDNIDVTINSEEKTLNISHKKPSIKSTRTFGERQDKTLDFGDSFNVLNIEKNLTGHVNNIETKTITLPKNSLTHKVENGNNLVVTDIELTPSTGEIIYTTQDINKSKISLLNLKYDFNNDGVVNGDDLTILSKHVAEISLVTDPALLSRMDINGDGIIDAADMSILAWLINNPETTLSETITNLNIDTHSIKSDINTIERDINNIENLLGVTEGTTSLTVQDQINAALEDFKTNILKDYALKSYVDEEIEKATKVDTNTQI